MSGNLAHTIDEFATLARVCRVTVYAMIRDGKLVARKVGRRTLIADSDARAFIDSLPIMQPVAASRKARITNAEKADGEVA